MLALHNAPLYLSTCCGLEWILHGVEQLTFSPNSIFCRNPAGTFISLTQLQSNLSSNIICPCTYTAVGQRLTIYQPSLNDCVFFSYFRLLGSTCQYLPTCPPGFRVRIVHDFLEQSEVIVKCIFNNSVYGNLTTLIRESACERKRSRKQKQTALFCSILRR